MHRILLYGRFIYSLLSLQLSKLVCIPFTLMVQYVAYKQTVSRAVQFTLIPITFGVGYATIYDLSLNPVGLGNIELNRHF